MIILPRQARDEHRESAQKKCRFPSVTGTGGMDGMRTCSVQHYFTFRMGRPLSLNLTAICTNVERGAGTSANLLSLAHLFPALGNGPAYFARRLLNTPNASSIVGGFDEAVVALLRWSSNGSAADLDALPHRCETHSIRRPFCVIERPMLCQDRLGTITAETQMKSSFYAGLTTPRSRSPWRARAGAAATRTWE